MITSHLSFLGLSQAKNIQQVQAGQKAWLPCLWLKAQVQHAISLVQDHIVHHGQRKDGLQIAPELWFFGTGLNDVYMLQIAIKWLWDWCTIKQETSYDKTSRDVIPENPWRVNVCVNYVWLALFGNVNSGVRACFPYSKRNTRWFTSI